MVAEELAARITGRTVLEATAPAPILVRATPAELASLAGVTVGSARRRGKFLLLPFEQDGRPFRLLAANPMLAGRFWLLPDGTAKVRARTGLRLRFADGGELRYVDREMLGKLYLVAPDGLDAIPGWTEMGPDADDPELTLDVFRQRIRRHPGELKSLLRNSRFVAGIGNAYSDEILWEAKLAPLRRRSSLRPEESTACTPSMRSVLEDAKVRAAGAGAAEHRAAASRVPEGPPARRRAMPALREAAAPDRRRRGDHLLPELPAAVLNRELRG